MSLFEKNASSAPSSIMDMDASNFVHHMITAEQLSSTCATPEDESISGASTTNEDCAGTPTSLPTDESMNANAAIGDFSRDASNSATSPSKLKRLANAGSAANAILPNGKKTKGRVKIKMEFIDNKLRRYTTFSKRKTGIMKKALELSTLTGTQVMLLVASETGHVYTFATKKLRPMIMSDAGKALIQTCLNTPDSPDGSHGSDTSAMSANFHTSEIASLTPASLLFASGVAGSNSNSMVSQQHRQSTGSKRSHKVHHNQSQSASVQDAMAAAGQSHSGANCAKVNNGMVNDLSTLNSSGLKSATKTRYYNDNELPTMVPPNSASRFSTSSSTPNFLSPTVVPALCDEDNADEGELADLSMLVEAAKTNQSNAREFKSDDTSDASNGGAKRRPICQTRGLSPSSPTPSSTCSTNAPAGSTLNSILQTIVANRQQQRQQNVSSMTAQNQQANPIGLQHQNRRKRHLVTTVQHISSKQANLSGHSSITSHASDAQTVSAMHQLGSKLFPLAGLIPASTSVGGATMSSQAINQQAALSLFPALSSGAFLYPPGIVYTPTPVSLPEGAAAALALQHMLASVVAAANNNANGDGNKTGQRAQTPSTSCGLNSSTVIQSTQHPMFPLPLPLSMMTANYLASQQQQREMEEFDEGAQGHLDEEESD